MAKECAEGRVIRPLQPALHPTVHISRIGIIPKKSTGKWRLIVDLSSPEGFSVNDGIEEGLCSLSYIFVDHAVRAAMELGQGALMAKIDVRSAYRIVPVHPEDQGLLGMMWEGSLFIDTAFPSGLHSAQKIFNAIADTVEWFARQQGVDPLLHYLDDFFTMGAPDSPYRSVHLTILYYPSLST